MNLPSKVTVLGTEFTIKIAALKGGDLGLFDYAARTITIHKGIKEQRVAESALLHEIIHASLAISGVNQLFKEDLEEAITWCLEHSLINLYELRR